MLDLIAPFLGSMARHALTTVAGTLVAQGLLQANQVNSFVGACMLFVGIGWAAWQKLNRPEMLAKLQERQAQKNIAAKLAVAKTFESSPNVLLAFGLCAVFAFLSFSPPASAQTWPWEPAKKVYRVKAKMPAPMKAGLISLVTGKADPVDTMFERLQSASITDLEYAKALADGVKDSPAAAQRSKCYGAWLGMLATLTSVQAVVEGAAERPGAAHLFTRFEQMSQVADSLAPMSSFQLACAPVAQSMRMNIGQFVLSVIGGGLSLGKLGVLP